MNINFQNIKALLFDFDGTVVDTMGGYADIAGDIISSFSDNITFEQARQLYLDTSGVPFFQQLEIILPENSENSILSEKFEEKKQDGLYKSRFSDVVELTINELRKRGYLAGISSNNYQHMVDKFISQNSLDFDVVLGYKPGFAKGKDHFDWFMKNFNVSRDGLLFVGDSLKDAEKALENNISFIGLSSTFSEEDFKKLDSGLLVIDSLEELLLLCE